MLTNLQFLKGDSNPQEGSSTLSVWPLTSTVSWYQMRLGFNACPCKKTHIRHIGKLTTTVRSRGRGWEWPMRKAGWDTLHLVRRPSLSSDVYWRVSFTLNTTSCLYATNVLAVGIDRILWRSPRLLQIQYILLVQFTPGGVDDIGRHCGILLYNWLLIIEPLVNHKEADEPNQ